MRWIGKKEQHEYMRLRQDQNRSRWSEAEEWASNALQQTEYRWSRQAIWGCRLFDFWNHELGIAVEIDGPEHNAEYDSVRDRYNYFCSGILVLRVRNFCEPELVEAIAIIARGETKQERKSKIRAELGLPASASRKEVLLAAGIKKAHLDWEPT